MLYLGSVCKSALYILFGRPDRGTSINCLLNCRSKLSFFAFSIYIYLCRMLLCIVYKFLKSRQKFSWISTINRVTRNKSYFAVYGSYMSVCKLLNRVPSAYNSFVLHVRFLANILIKQVYLYIKMQTYCLEIETDK